MNRPNIERLMETLGDILSEKHGAEIRLRARLKEEYEHEKHGDSGAQREGVAVHRQV